MAARPSKELKAVVLAGDPVQIGLDHGRRLGQEIQHLVRQMDRHVFRWAGRVHGFGLKMAVRTLVLAMNRHIPLHLREEMRGVSDGSGVAYGDLLLLNCLDDALNILRRLAPRVPKLGCSSFVLLGGRCRDGSLLHGRNLDYHFRNTPLDDYGAVARLMAKHSMLFVYRPQGRAEFVSVGWPGLVGATTAMNQDGLALGNLTSYVRGTTPNGVPSSLLYRQLMEDASSLSDAGRILKGARRTIGNNLVVSSGREGAAILFEITRDVVSEVIPDSGTLAVTNHFQSPALAIRQRPYLTSHSLARWKRLRFLCDRSGVELAEAFAFLRDTGCVGTGIADCRSMTLANEGTAVSVLFRPEEMQFWLGMCPEPPTSQDGFISLEIPRLLKLPLGISAIETGPI